MKLNRDNYIKIEYQGGTLYQYTCNEINFFLFVEGKGQDKKMSVFKGNVDDRQEEFTTSDTLEAWNKFEEYLTACESDQGSSGGFRNNPQQNPNILPLLAIKRLDSGDFTVNVFGLFENGEQITVMAFTVGANALNYPFPSKVFVVNWQEEEIPTLFKCEIVMRKYSDVEYQEDKDCEVFLFIPKSIVNQGGEEGGNTQGAEQGEPQPNGDEQPDGDGEPDGQPDGEPQPSDDGQPDDDGEPSDEQTEDEEPTQGNGTSTGERIPDDTPPIQPPPVVFGDIINQLAQTTNTQPSTIVNVFRSVNTGETWLQANNFENIKRQLNLPPSTSARDFSQQIINSK